MKLNNCSLMGLAESRIFVRDFVMSEDGEAPRWQFRYDNYHVDPNPNILLLGAYRHPNTGNYLVGGININYLDPPQIANLSKMLPQIMSGGNLQVRYRIGERILPEIFTSYYRTYDAEYIRGVKKGVMYPKRGLTQTVRKWLKNIFQTKKKREQEDQPEFPDDLQGMQDRLDGAIQQIHDTPGRFSDDPQTPEIQQALAQYDKLQRDKKLRQAGLKDVDTDMVQQALAADVQDTEEQDAEEQETQATQPRQRTQPKQQRQPRQAQPADAEFGEFTPQERARSIERERQENAAELSDVTPEELDEPDELDEPAEFPDDDLVESITYWSATQKRYITEHFIL